MRLVNLTQFRAILSLVGAVLFPPATRPPHRQPDFEMPSSWAQGCSAGQPGHSWDKAGPTMAHACLLRTPRQVTWSSRWARRSAAPLRALSRAYCSPARPLSEATSLGADPRDRKKCLHPPLPPGPSQIPQVCLAEIRCWPASLRQATCTKAGQRSPTGPGLWELSM